MPRSPDRAAIGIGGGTGSNGGPTSGWFGFLEEIVGVIIAVALIVAGIGLFVWWLLKDES